MNSNRVLSSDGLQKLFKSIMGYLKEDGRLLFLCANRFGMKYWCGGMDENDLMPFDGIRGKGSELRLTRQKLISILEQSEYVKGWKLYYPMPDYRFPQAVYTDEYLPKTSVRDRVIPYYTQEQRKGLICLEDEISDEIISNKIFPVFANSFLVECGCQPFTSDVIYAALSTDRGKEHGFTTIVFSKGHVWKKIISKEGRKSLKIIYDNQIALKNRGITCVPQILEKNYIEMPYIKSKVFADYLKELFLTDRYEVEKAFDILYFNILASSKTVDFSRCMIKHERLNEENAGVILERAYIDMIPYNCFYNNGILMFYDQEFIKENYPAKFVLFRAIRYTYIYIKGAESIIPIQFFKEKYALDDVWDIFEGIEADFVEDNRNYDLMSSFYSCTNVSAEEIDKNIQRLMHRCESALEIPKADGKLKRRENNLDIYKKDIELNRIKQSQLEMLKSFIDICEKNGLAYCAIYGTLLGAVRHKGFVPWDDDVDLAMPREDYDKLLEMAPKFIKQPFYLLTPENDTENFYGGYSKLIRVNSSGAGEVNGSLDIFPLDTVPEEERDRKKQRKWIEIYQCALWQKTYRKRGCGNKPADNKLTVWLLRKLPQKILSKKLNRVLSSYRDRGSDRVAILARFYRNDFRTQYSRSDFRFLINYKFEDILLPIPNGYENCLIQDYGIDYMIYPKEKDRIPHHIKKNESLEENGNETI